MVNTATHVHHFTDQAGYNAITGQRDWVFRANKPPGNHPFGAYFTNLPPGTPNLANRLRIPRAKLTHYFAFVERPGDFIPLLGGRGQFVSYSKTDYTVEVERQVASGSTGL